VVLFSRYSAAVMRRIANDAVVWAI